VFLKVKGTGMWIYLALYITRISSSRRADTYHTA